MWIDWSDFLLQVAPSNPKSDWILTELVDSTEMVPDAYPDHRKSPQWRPSKCLRTGEHGGARGSAGRLGSKLRCEDAETLENKVWLSHEAPMGEFMLCFWLNYLGLRFWLVSKWCPDSWWYSTCFCFLVGFPETMWDMSWLWLIPSGWRWRSHVTRNHYLYGLTKYIKHAYTDIIRHIDNYI